MSPGAPVGVLGAGELARVDEAGAVCSPALRVDWLVGAPDRWHVPADERSTRRRRAGAAPVYETTLRVPAGEAALTTFGAHAGTAPVVALEVENRSGAALSVAFVVAVAERAAVAIDGGALRVGGRPVLALARPPGVWAAGPSAGALLTGGAARPGPFEPVTGPVEVALCWPVPHRTRLRLAIAGAPVDVRAIADPAPVARGWDAVLERGLRADLPLAAGDAVDPARADLLLASRTDPLVAAALEDWGFDAEAAAAWAGLGWRARRRARARALPARPWAALGALDPVVEPVRWLQALHAVLVRERRGGVDLLPGFPPEWLGSGLGVDAAPLRAGTLSFAVRWHGARPALLWESPPGVELRAPALDPSWTTRSPAGEELLAAPASSLLPMGAVRPSAGPARAVGAPGPGAGAPEAFS